MNYSNRCHRLFHMRGLLLLPVFILQFAHIAFAQVTAKGPIVRFGNMPYGPNTDVTGTYEQLLSDTHFICPQGYKITSFQVSFQPKGMDFIGPFVLHCDSLQQQEIEVIRRIREKHPPSTKMVLEEIRIFTPDGIIRTFAPFTFTLK